jgi:hypothetical protein
MFGILGKHSNISWNMNPKLLNGKIIFDFKGVLVEINLM